MPPHTPAPNGPRPSAERACPSPPADLTRTTAPLAPRSGHNRRRSGHLPQRDTGPNQHKASVKTIFEALVTSYYQAPCFKGLKTSTKAEYRRTLELHRENNGPKDFAKLRRTHVIAARDKYADQWRKANAMVEQLSILSRHAIDLEWITANPAQGVEKLKGGSYEAWPEPKLIAYEKPLRTAWANDRARNL